MKNPPHPLLFVPVLGLLASILPINTVAQTPARPSLPTVPAGLKVELIAQEPLVRNPCAMAFDAKGRLFVGQGPQYRNPKPDTPPDSVLIMIDRNGDGVVDATKTFATGFNCIQGLAWHGRDLWVGNSPDLTIVRDLDGDDEADEYVLVYTDLGNIEHAIHGLNWAPDGKLYFSKGNSKGLSQPGRIAPKPFRDLWDVKAPPGSPDFPPPRTFRKGEYKSTYQDPSDDWGREGGVLRCDDLGANLEIVSRGTRNCFDISFDSGFNWLGTDNDQSEGDRILMPFQGAHFGWAHRWSTNWTGYLHLPTAPISGPVFEGSGTGVLYYDLPQMPEKFRHVWFINDFLRKTTFVYRPRWDGALLQPDGGNWEEFARGGDALFKPIDIEAGPDGALYLTGWGTNLGAVWKDGRQANEGRIFRISWPGTPVLTRDTQKRVKPLAQWTSSELLADFDSPIPACRVDAQTELVRRGTAVKADLTARLARKDLTPAAETWTLWTLGRIGPGDTEIDAWFANTGGRGSLNARIQSIRIAAHRIREFRRSDTVPDFVVKALTDTEPRVRFAAVQAIGQARQKSQIDRVYALSAVETDRLTFYSVWHTLKDLATPNELRSRLTDNRAGVRRAALLALLEQGALDRDAVVPLVRDADGPTAEVAALWLAKQSGNPLIDISPRPGEFVNEVAVKFTPGLKPSSIRFTTDGTEPTAATRSRTTVTLTETTTLKVGLFVEDKQVGKTVAATWYKRSPLPPPPAVTLSARTEATTMAQVLPLVKSANPENGRGVFSAAGCYVCHRVAGEGRAIGPDLNAMGDRGDPQHIIRSLLEPSADITEGFALITASTRDGKSFAGIFQEETDRILTLLQVDGERASIEKSAIATRESTHFSLMPSFGTVLSPEQTADVTAWLLTQRTLPGPAGSNPSVTRTTSLSARSGADPAAAKPAFSWELKADRLAITFANEPVADYVFSDTQTLRPHFQNVRAPGGVQVTRNHPPLPSDPADHATMHPGVWMAFGDINGEDFWRNKARIVHDRFTEPPTLQDGQLRFAVVNRLIGRDNQVLALQTSRVALARAANGYRISCDTTFRPEGRDLIFGDQEEMGFGVRMATALTEKNGGLVTNSSQLRGAKTTWGQLADWCDYSGTMDGRRVGVIVFAHPKNPQRSWWHTRDYGLVVANPFGNRVLAPEMGGKLTVRPGERLRLRFGVLLYNAAPSEAIDHSAAYRAFVDDQR